MLDSPGILGAEKSAPQGLLSATEARDSLVLGAERLRSHPVMAQVFSRRSNPMWRLVPSAQACEALLTFWHRRTPEGVLVYDFTDEMRSTDFLQDVYANLVQHAQKSYASVPAPGFVADLVLNLALKPAIDKFASSPSGLAEFRTIDPACGSGTFLLGAFDRLFRQWTKFGPDMSPWQRAARALRSVHGADINPCAVIISRFRLLVAAMNATGERRLNNVPDVSLVVTAGDSLLHGRGTPHALGLLREQGPAPFAPAEELAEYSRRYGLLDHQVAHLGPGPAQQFPAR